MAIEDLAHLTEATFLVFSIVFSWFIFFPIGVNLGEFHGHCLLYSTGTWKENRSLSEQELIADWANLGACVYNVLIGGVAFILSFIQIIVTISHFIRGTDRSFLSAFMQVIQNALVSILLIISTLTVFLGFQVWCDAITTNYKPPRKCNDVTIHLRSKSGESHMDSSDFYLLYTLARIGCCCVLLSYLVLLLVASRRLHIYHRREPITRSLWKERKRLTQSIYAENRRYSSINAHDPNNLH